MNTSRKFRKGIMSGLLNKAGNFICSGLWAIEYAFKNQILL
jgi:hypothetical protein